MLRTSAETLTTEFQAMRAAGGAVSARTGQYGYAVAGLALPPRPQAQACATHTPWPDYSQESAVLLIRPRKRMPDRYKLMHHNMISEHLTPDEIGVVEPNYAKAANRYRVTFSTGEMAVKFHNFLKERPCVYRLTGNGEFISLCIFWPLLQANRQGGASSAKSMRHYVDVGDLQGHLRLNYPRGPKPVIVVSVVLGNNKWGTSSRCSLLTAQTTRLFWTGPPGRFSSSARPLSRVSQPRRSWGRQPRRLLGWLRDPMAAAMREPEEGLVK